MSASQEDKSQPAGNGLSRDTQVSSSSDFPSWVTDTLQKAEQDKRRRPWQSTFGGEIGWRFDTGEDLVTVERSVYTFLPWVNHRPSLPALQKLSLLLFANHLIIPLAPIFRLPNVSRLQHGYRVFINVPDDAKDKRTTNLVFEDVAVGIHNLRPLMQTTSLDQHGFIYREYKTQVQDLTDRISVEKNYLPEIEHILRQEVDDANRIFFFDWRLRKNAPEVEGSVIDLNDLTSWLRPAMHVHVDQSPLAVLNRVRLQLPEEADELLKGRVRVINIWRPLVDVVEDWPLAICDGSTVDPSDLVEADHVRRHYTGSTMYLKHHARQRFFYLDRQTKDEILIFKNFDSHQHLPATFAPHASFPHPKRPDGCIPRRSIEVRALVFTHVAK